MRGVKQNGHRTLLFGVNNDEFGSLNSAYAKDSANNTPVNGGRACSVEEKNGYPVQ